MKLLTNKKPSNARIYLITAIILLLICLIGMAIAERAAGKKSEVEMLQVNGRNFSLEVASTPAEQELGLGNRTSLAKDRGMLFVFAKPDIECFWMKDMHFPLDMIWLDQNKKVVYIKQYVSPNTYPQTFCPTEPAKYVIELNAGIAKSANIHSGQTVIF